MELIIVAAIIALVAVVVVFNRLVKLRNTVRSSWSDIDVQLKKRFDLVPSLVETVKGYASHEKGVFEKVTEARSQAMSAGSPREAAEKDNLFSQTLKSLFAVAEAYPELKANENFVKLQGQFQDLENGIESARRYYNAVVRDLNISVESFPSNVVASMFGFKQEEFFQLDSAEERKPIKPDFSS
jgi:LemA protein